MGLHLYSGTSVQEIVGHDPRTQIYFERLGFDYSYHGHQTVAEVAAETGKESEICVEEIRAIIGRPQKAEHIRFIDWPLDLLIDYMVKKHHRYSRDEVPVLDFYLHKVCRVHGERHPELFEIRSIFETSEAELLGELGKQEALLFPQILKMYRSKREGNSFEKIEDFDLTGILKEHYQQQLRQRDFHRTIEELSKGYVNPKDGCTSYRIGMQKLCAFKEDLTVQAHIKNNILFPRARRLHDYFQRQLKYENL